MRTTWLACAACWCACATTAPDAGRSTPPPARGPAASTQPAIRSWQLPNGLTVVVIEDPSLPLESVDCAFLAGSASDPAGKEGLANLTLHAWFSGRAKESQGLGASLIAMGTHPFLLVTPDGALAGGTVLSERADAAIASFATHLKQPTFEPGTLAAARDEALHELGIEDLDPRIAAKRALAAQVYGKDHPYGRSVRGLRGFLEKARNEDAQAFFRDHIAPSSTAIILAGSMRATDALAAVERHLGNWAGRALVPEVPSAPVAPPRAGIVFLPRPGLTQSIVVVGRAGAAAGSGDEVPVLLASRTYEALLSKQFREETSWTYSVEGNANMSAEPGLFWISASVRADATGLAVQRALWMAQRLSSDVDWVRGVPLARDDIGLATFDWFNGLDRQAEAAARSFWAHQPAGRYEALLRAVGAARAEAVAQAARTYFDPRYLQVVVVGDPAIYSTQLANLNFEAPPPMSGAGAAGRARDRYEVAVRLLGQSRYSEALGPLNEAIELQPGFVEAYLARGGAQIGVRRFEGAAADYEYARKLDPTRAAPLFGLAEAYRLLGRSAEAATFYRKYAESAAPDARADLKEDALRKERECTSK